MTNTINSTTPGATSPERLKLQRAARDFESILIADLLKTAPRSGSLDGGNSQEAGLQGYDDLRTEAMASALAGQGGIGIARMLLKQLGPSRDKPDIKAFSSTADHVIAGE